MAKFAVSCKLKILRQINFPASNKIVQTNEPLIFQAQQPEFEAVFPFYGLFFK